MPIKKEILNELNSIITLLSLLLVGLVSAKDQRKEITLLFGPPNPPVRVQGHRNRELWKTRITNSLLC